ncbi:MAG: hypothetical protein ACOYN5_14120 [Bacteroidales bacterium]
MALTVIETPPAYALIEHGLICKVQTNKTWTQAVASWLRLRLPTDLAAYYLKYFTLLVDDVAYVFKFRTVPDDSGFELRVAPGTYELFRTQLVEDLNRCYFIYSNFIVATDSTDGIRLTAREKGAKWNIEFGETDITGITWSQMPGVDEAMPKDYKVLMALISSGKLIAESLAPIDNFGIASCDFASLVRDLITTGFTFPVNTDKVIVHQNSSLLLQLGVAEYANNTILRLNYDASFIALPGGLKQADVDLLSLNNADYFGYMDMKSRFLNWCPDNKITAWGVPERLYFLNYEKVPVFVKALIHRNSLLDIEVTLAEISTNDTYFEVLCGLHEIIPEIDYTSVISYEIYCNTESDSVIEPRTFILDQTQFHHQRVLLFKNSFGVYETFRTTGDLQVNDNITKDIIESIDNRIYRLKVHKSENNAKFTLYSGWLEGVEQRRWLEEILLSKDVYWLQGEFALPIILQNGEIEREQDWNFNYALKIDFMLDITENRYSGIVNEGLIYLRDENYVIIQDEAGINLIDF